MSDNPYQAPRSSRGGLQLGDQPLEFALTPEQRNAGPSGLGGWLILVGLKLVVSIFVNSGALLTQFLPLFRNGVWAALTTPGSDGYHPLWGPLVLLETVGNGAFLVASLVLLAMFFMKSPSFPRWMIALLIANVLFQCLDVLLGSRIPGVVDASQAGTTIGRATVGALIWVPYLLSSTRVRNTFRAPWKPAPRREPRWDAGSDPNPAP